MISSPQGDLKHTGHVGLDGAYFGDVSFLGDKVSKHDLHLLLFLVKDFYSLVSTVAETSCGALQAPR